MGNDIAPLGIAPAHKYKAGTLGDLLGNTQHFASLGSLRLGNVGALVAMVGDGVGIHHRKFRHSGRGAGAVAGAHLRPVRTCREGVACELLLIQEKILLQGSVPVQPQAELLRPLRGVPGELHRGVGVVEVAVRFHRWRVGLVHIGCQILQMQMTPQAVIVHIRPAVGGGVGIHHFSRGHIAHMVRR